MHIFSFIVPFQNTVYPRGTRQEARPEIHPERVSTKSKSAEEVLRVTIVYAAPVRR